MPLLSQQLVEPESVGLCSKRLANIEKHISSKYLETGRLAGTAMAIGRSGKVAYTHTTGNMDRDSQTAMREDAIFRIYSMTKPLTSIAVMQLVEQGIIALQDPVHRYLPQFRKLRVWQTGSWPDMISVPTQGPMRIWHLLTHMSGLTYGFQRSHNIDAAYRRLHIDESRGKMDIDEWLDTLVQIPLQFEPGTAWCYSVATDVLGAVVAKVAGMSLGEYFDKHICQPLGMEDTFFTVPQEKASRLASLYEYVPKKEPRQIDTPDSQWLLNKGFQSGGGGLASTLYDYYLFADALRNGGLGNKETGGARIIGPRTLEYMTQNHLPDNQSLSDLANSLFSEITYDGTGFGLGFHTITDPAATKTLTHYGEYGWGGMASTVFWVDPQEDLIAVFMTQLVPSATWPIRPELRALVNAAIIDA